MTRAMGNRLGWTIVSASWWVGELGHYRIVARLGGGGMGEVYAADDLKLHRRVALKVLPVLAGVNQQRRDRFFQEARAVAALTHPNIVTVHSIEEVDGQHFLTMELIEGQTLAARIPSRGMPLPALLAIAIPMVDAVDAAHARGITHRDLKPANVMVTSEGRVKVLDFGLAKLQEPSERVLGGETQTAAGLTGEGRIVGTVAYMSPEQAESKPVDHRSDVFSIGVMLYEMASGERPFKGDSTLSVLSSVLRDQPQPLADLNPALPRDLSRIVRKCLAKDPDRRYQSAKDLRLDLEELRADLASGELFSPIAAGAAGPRRWPRRATVALIAATSVAAVAVGLAAWQYWRQSSPALAPEWHFTQITSLPAVENQVSLSPDGRWISYVHPTAEGSDILLLGVGGTNAINLTERSGAWNEWPAFSPNGERLAFSSSRQGGGLFVMGRTGESVRRVTDFGEQPSWSPDGRTLIFCTNAVLSPLVKSGVGGLWAVDVDTGGAPRRIDGGYDVMMPRVSPNNRRIAYWGFVSASDANRNIFTIPVGGGAPVPVAADAAVDWNPIWAPDGQSLYFLSDRGGTMQIWQVDIDESSGRPVGPPRALTTPSRFVQHLSISADGRRLAYSALDSRSNIVRSVFDPAAAAMVGEPVPLTTGSRAWTTPSPSPDGTMIAFTSTMGQEDLFVARADGTGLTQLTNDAARDRSPKWSPDGTSLAFHSDRGGSFSIWTVQADGRGLTRVLDPGGDMFIIPVWSPNGRRLAVSKGAVHRPWIVERTADGWGPPRALAAPADGFSATGWSADGQWLIGMSIGGGWRVGAVNVDTQEYRKLADGPGYWPVWLPDSRRFLVGTPRTLNLGDMAARPNAIGRVVAKGPIAAFDLSLDGRWLLTAAAQDEADLWMMELTGPTSKSR